MKIPPILTPVCIAAVSVAMVFASAPSAFGWAEDFESYADGDAFSTGSNPNGWAAYGGTVTTKGFGGPYNDASPSIATVVDIGGNIRGDFGAAPFAAVGSLPVVSGVAKLQFDFTTDSATGNSRLNHGIQLIDTVSGGIAKAYTDYAGWFVEYTDSSGAITNAFTADFGAYNDPIPQTVTLTLDYDHDTMNLFATASDGVSALYTGNTLVFEDIDLPIADAGFVPNEIVYHSRWGGGGSEIDNISYPSLGTPPPPATDFTWRIADSGNFNNAANWIGGGPPGNQAAVQSSYHTATFADEIGSNTRTVFTDDGVTVNAINFTNTMGGSYRLGGGPAYNLIASTSGTLPTLVVTGGSSHEFQASVSIHADTTADIDGGSTLIFNNALTLNGNMLTKSGTGEMAIRNDLLTNGGTVSIQQGALSGNGTVSGDLTNDGGTISPGNSLEATSAVPEPGTWLLTAVGLLCLVAGYQRPRNSH